MSQAKMERIKEKKVDALQLQINSLSQELTELRKKISEEAKTLERLRNEEGHIENRLKDLNIKESSHQEKVSEYHVNLHKDVESLLKRKELLDEQEKKGKKTLEEASRHYKEAQSTLRAVEEGEKRNAASKNEVTNGLNKLERAQKDLETRKNDLNSQFLVLEDKKKEIERLQQEYTISSRLIKTQFIDLEKEKEEIRKITKENQQVIIDAKVFKEQANQILEEAKKKTEEGQLSVDRQFNEITIQNQKLKARELRIKKLIEKYDLKKELKELEK